VPTGAYAAVDIPQAVQVTAASINAANVIAGSYVDVHGVTHAFLSSLSGGSLTSFTVPGAQITQFLGVNAKGVAVGFYQLPNGVPQGLLYNSANSQWQTLNAPNGPLGATLNGLNDRGQIVGFYTDAAAITHGLLIGSAF
jgi:hypothetical protein